MQFLWGSPSQLKLKSGQIRDPCALRASIMLRLEKENIQKGALCKIFAMNIPPRRYVFEILFLVLFPHNFIPIYTADDMGLSFAKHLHTY